MSRRNVVTRRASGSADNAIARRRRTRSREPETSTLPEIFIGNGNNVMMPLLPNRPNYASLRKHKGTAYVHVSDLLNKCSRKVALAYVHDVDVVEMAIFDSLSLTFRQGEAIHDHVRDVVSKSHPHEVYADWSCRCGHTHFEGILSQSLQRKVCERCHTQADNHNEVPVHDDEYHIVGSPDLLLYRVDGFYITEIKSMAARYWDELEQPLPEHIIQVIFYWVLMRRAGKPLHDHVSILYVNKEFRPRNPYKEYTVFVPDMVDRLGIYFEEAAGIKSAIAGGPLPERTVCQSQNTKTAKECELCAICFSME